MTTRSVIRLGVGFGLALALVLMHQSVAQAHAILLAAAPNANGLFPAEKSPTVVRLTFSEAVAPSFSAIRVFDESGESVTNGDLLFENSERTIVAVALRPLPVGIYTVAWSVLSAIDGHTSSGSYAFGVGVIPARAATTSLPAPTAASLGSRWLGLTGQVVLLGLFAFQLLVWQPAVRANAREMNGPGDGEPQAQDSLLPHEFRRGSLAVGWIGLALLGIGLALALAQLPASLGASTTAGLIGNVQAWLATRYGGLWFIRFCLTIGLAMGLADLGEGLSGKAVGSAKQSSSGLQSWVWWAGLALSAGLGLTATYTSHSAALQDGAELAVLGDAAHVLAAGVWVGGLLQLVLAARLIGLAIPAFVVASLNLFVIRPCLAAARGLPAGVPTALHKRFRQLVLIEGACGVAVVAAAGVMTDLQPGRDALLLAEESHVTVFLSADDLRETLTVEPGQWGQTNTFDVYLLDSRGRPVPNASDVSLRFTFLDQVMGTSKASAESTGGGHYRATGPYFTLGGTWQVEVVVRRPDAFDAFATVYFDTTPQGLITALDSGSWSDRLIDWLNSTGSGAAGVILFLFSMAWVVPAVLSTWYRGWPALALAFLPSLVGTWVAALLIAHAITGVPGAPSGDPRALTWLVQSEAAMNQLTSVQLLRTTHGDTGAGLTETISFQAPNMFRDQMSNGAENRAQGVMYYYYGLQDQRWQAVRQQQAFVFPNFDLSGQAVGARLGRIEEVDGRPAQKVVFTVYLLRNPVPYARWIDVETKLILRETMDAPGHHMLSIYHDFNVPVTIPLPGPSEIGPPPTPIIPRPTN